MSIKKQYLKKKPVCKVTFRVPKEEAKNVGSVCVTGDFNDWDESQTPMKSLKNGEFSVTIDLDINREYQFRYLMDQKNWKNDTSADKFVYSEYGNCDNSVIVV